MAKGVKRFVVVRETKVAKKGEWSACDRRFQRHSEQSRNALATLRSEATKKENARRVWVAAAGEGREGCGCAAQGE